jgi:hypothetical protein
MRFLGHGNKALKIYFALLDELPEASVELRQGEEVVLANNGKRRV